MGRKRPKKNETDSELDADPKGRRFGSNVGCAVLVIELIPVLGFACLLHPDPDGWDRLFDLFTYVLFGLPLALVGTSVALPMVFIPKWRNYRLGIPLLALSLSMFIPGTSRFLGNWLAIAIMPR